MARLKRTSYVAFLLIAAFIVSSSDVIAGGGGDNNVEIYLGMGSPDVLKFDDGLFTFGIRAGHVFSDRWAIQGTVGHYSESDSHFAGSFWSTTWRLEASFIGYIETKNDSAFLLYFGPGVGWGDYSFNTGYTEYSGSDTYLLFHAGAGYNWQLSEKTYIRPDTRLFWKEFQVDDHVWEFSLALGRKF